MKLIGDLVKIQPNRIFLPRYHRVSPCLKHQTTVHGTLVPAQGGRRPELYLSPLPESSWPDIWRLELEFQDKQGIMARLTALLSDPAVGVNLLAHEIMIIPQANDPIGHINLICDMSHYGGRDNPDGTSDEREHNPDAQLDYLIDYLTLEFWSDLRFKGHRPQIYATRLRELQHVAALLRDLRTAAALAGKPGPDSFEVEILNGTVVLPRHVWDAFRSGSDPAADQTFLVTVASDTEERYLKVTPMTRDRDSFLLEVPHTDKKGQIARFTASLRDLGNIVSSYLRPIKADGLAVWRCLFETPAGAGERVRREIRQRFAVFQDDPLLDVKFPRPVSEEELRLKSRRAEKQRRRLLRWLFGLAVAAGLAAAGAWCQSASGWPFGAW